MRASPDAASALQTLRQAAFDAAVLDLEMPGMNGLELAAAIRREPALPPLRLLLLVPIASRKSQHQIVDAVLTKPVRCCQLYQALAGHSGPSPQSEVSCAPSPIGLRILIAEDNPVNRTVAVRMLEKRGFHVAIAVNGREAVEALDRASYDLIFMDCQMPEMDGYTATTEIRRREDPARRTPIVALTANALAYVIPSFVEGFGLNGLEAMASETPVICSKTGSLPEVYGQAAVYFNPASPEEMAEKIFQTLSNPILVQTLKQRGQEQVKKYDWDQTAKQTISIYHHAKKGKVKNHA